jgi:hypothetical protein
MREAVLDGMPSAFLSFLSLYENEKMENVQGSIWNLVNPFRAPEHDTWNYISILLVQSAKGIFWGSRKFLPFESFPMALSTSWRSSHQFL